MEAGAGAASTSCHHNNTQSSASGSSPSPASSTASPAASSPVMSSPGGGELGEVSAQVWSFVESQCWDADTGAVNTATISFWLRTLLQQNSDLVEVVARLERDARDRVQLLEDKLGKTSEVREELTSSLQARAEDRAVMEEAIGELEARLQTSMEDNKASELLVDALSDKNKELEAVNTRLRENMAVVEEDNTNLKEYVENLRSDIDSLLKLSARARDSGVWDPHDLSWCEVTFEQVFGGEEERPGPSPRQPVTVRKVSRGSHQSSELYDSRSSLRSELSELRRRESVGGRDGGGQEDVGQRTDQASLKIRELRQQVMRLQRRGAEQVREVVQRDKLIAELQTTITELGGARDELSAENNANLSVIQRLKQSLAQTRTRLSCAELEDAAAAASEPGTMASTASLPEITVSSCRDTSGISRQSSCQYSSKFARSLTRQSASGSLVQQLTDQLDIAREEKRQLEQQLGELVAQLELAAAEKLSLDQQLAAVREQLEELGREHANLKDDFRTLVRKYDEDRAAAAQSAAGDTAAAGPVSRTKLLLETEEKLEAAILQLQLREAEMERVAEHLDTVTRRAEGRDRELEAAAARLEQLQRALADTEAENRRLGDTVSGQKAAILSLQAAVEADRRKEADTRHKHKTVRLIYKEHSDGSEDEAAIERHGFSNNNINNNAPRSFMMSSSDSFEI